MWEKHMRTGWRTNGWIDGQYGNECVCLSHNNRISHHINLIHASHLANCGQENNNNNDNRVFTFNFALYGTSSQANWMYACAYAPVQCDAMQWSFLVSSFVTYLFSVNDHSTVDRCNHQPYHACLCVIWARELMNNLVIKMKIDTHAHTHTLYGSK